MATDPEISAHFSFIRDLIFAGKVVPFLGAGINLCDRPDNVAWTEPDGKQLPSGRELTDYLAGKFYYPANDSRELARVSQYVTMMLGSEPLYDELHAIFSSNYAPTAIHRLLAGIPEVARSQNRPPSYQLIVTTNYDYVMERALEEAHEPFDVITYIADGEKTGKLQHDKADGTRLIIDEPDKYVDLPIPAPSFNLTRTVLLKIHGAVDRTSSDAENDSYVITEDHYIDYLTRTDITSLMPPQLVAKLRKSHFLFLGYGMRDWNLRVILHRLWRQQKLDKQSWAVQLNPLPIDRRFWTARDVEILDMSLQQYEANLRQRLEGI